MNKSGISALAQGVASTTNPYIEHLASLRQKYEAAWEKKHQEVSRHDDAHFRSFVAAALLSTASYAGMVAGATGIIVTGPAVVIPAAAAGTVAALAMIGKSVYHNIAKQREYQGLNDVYRPSDEDLVAAQKSLTEKKSPIWDRAAAALRGEFATHEDLRVRAVQEVMRERSI